MEVERKRGKRGKKERSVGERENTKVKCSSG
jgi:hypothetical protein